MALAYSAGKRWWAAIWYQAALGNRINASPSSDTIDRRAELIATGASWGPAGCCCWMQRWPVDVVSAMAAQCGYEI